MWRILQQDKPDDYVLATNETRTVREFAQLAFQEVGTEVEWRGQGVAEKGYDIKFGARPLKRAIQKYLEDEMAEVIIQAEVAEGDIIKVDRNEEKNGVKVEILHSEKEKEKEEPKKEA